MKKPAGDTGKIARSAGLVSVAIMCSRVLGLVREQAFAILFGAGFAFDAFVVAFRIPNLLRDLFGEGALSSAFVTVFTDYDANTGEAETWRLANTVLAFFAIFLSLVTLAGCLFSRELITLFVDRDFELIAGKVELTRKLTVIMFPFLVFISLAAVVMGMLNSKGRFFMPAMASSFFNLGSIVSGVGLAYLMPRFDQPAIAGMAIGTLIGGLLQLACQLPSLYQCGFRPRLSLHFNHPGLLRILRLMGPAVIGLSATQANIFINTYFASSCQEGSISWLNYAFRLVQLPIGVFGVALSTAALPLLARSAAQKDYVRLKETLLSALIMAFCLTVPASVGLYLLSDEIIRLLFEHGRFTAFSTQMTSQALRYYAIGLLAYACVKIVVPVFYTLDNTRYPVVGSFLSVACNMAVVSIAISPLGHRAMALSVSCAMTVNLLFLCAVLYRKLAGFSLAYLARGFAKVAVSAAVMGLWLVLLRQWLAPLFAGGIAAMILALTLAGTTSVMLYAAMLYFLRLQELQFLTAKLSSRLRGPQSG